MKIPFNVDSFPDAKPGDIVDLVASGVVSDDGKVIKITSIEDTEIDEDDDDDDDEDDEEGKGKETEEVTEETETTGPPADLSMAMEQFAKQA